MGGRGPRPSGVGWGGGGWGRGGIVTAPLGWNGGARLKFDLDGMIAAAEPDAAGGVSLQGRFTDPRFERIYSGWYWQIVPDKITGGAPGSDQTQISRSLFDKTIRRTDTSKSKTLIWGHGIGPENQRLPFVARHVEFPILSTAAPGDTRGYTFLVASDMSEIQDQIEDFNQMLFWSFALLGAGLIGAMLFQVRIGLQPLRRLPIALAHIRDGKARRLVGDFPTEIEPLATEVNNLIGHSEEVVGRARTHVSNLAHALKTPLSVLTSEAHAEPGPLARDATSEQTAAHDHQTAETARYKLGKITTSDADGYHRVMCPAVMGKIRCPLRPASMTLDRQRPEILTPPGHPPDCCAQQTLTVPPDVAVKTRQKHDYPSAAHRRSYARRTGAERTFSTAKDPATNNIARGWCRLTGLAPLMLWLACLMAVRNQRILTAWTARQDDNARRAAAGLPPRTRRRRRKTLIDLATAGTPP